MALINDQLFPSDNSFDIPCLLLENQAQGVILPFTPCSAGHKASLASTIHFYVDDYRFNSLWRNPAKILTKHIKQIVEVNYSLYDTTPIARGLERIYKKRWLARYWQQCGLRVFVDLNVSSKYIEYNKLGIPTGYNAFATRGIRGNIDALITEHTIAREISGLQTPNLVVYGGGKEIHSYCMENSLLYITDFMTETHERLRSR